MADFRQSGEVYGSPSRTGTSEDSCGFPVSNLPNPATQSRGVPRQMSHLADPPCSGDLSDEGSYIVASRNVANAIAARLGEQSLADAPNYNFAANLPRNASLTNPESCSLYFLAGAGLIKIGISTNLTSRIRSIRNSSPVALELLATMSGSTIYEGFAHDEFGHLRQHGEWFEDEGSIRDYIVRMSKRIDRRVVLHCPLLQEAANAL